MALGAPGERGLMGCVERVLIDVVGGVLIDVVRGGIDKCSGRGIDIDGIVKRGIGGMALGAPGERGIDGYWWDVLRGC